MKRIIWLLLIIVMILGALPYISLGAETVFYENDFNTEEAQKNALRLADNGDGVYSVAFLGGIGGKKDEDYASVVEITPIGEGGGRASFEIPYYPFSQMYASSSSRTAELSMLYGGEADRAVLSVYMNKTGSFITGEKVLYEFVRIENGVVYALGKETDIRCDKNEWLKIAIEENYDIANVRLFINGRKIETGLSGHAIFGNRWTQAYAAFDSKPGIGSRAGILAIDDVKIYEGAYAELEKNGIIASPIECYVNGERETCFYEKGDVLTSKATAYATDVRSGLLLTAIYKDGMLYDMAADAKTFSGEAGFEVAYTIAEDTREISVKSMFLEDADRFRPMTDSVDYTAINKVYYNNELNSEKDVSFGAVLNSNKLDFMWENTIGGKNGFIRLTKDKAAAEYIYADIGKSLPNIVWEADIRYYGDMPALSYIIKDTVSQSSDVTVGFFEVKDGCVKTSKYSEPLPKNVWNKVSLVLDFESHCFEIYVNNKKIMQTMSFPTTMNVPSAIRFYAGGASCGSVDLDNIAVYAGKKPRDISGYAAEERDRFDNADFALNYLSDKKALHTYSNTMFRAGKKAALRNNCINYGDETLIPQDAFEWLFGRKVTLSGNTVSINGEAVMNIGKSVMTVDKAETKLVCPPEIIDGVLYLPAVAYGNVVCGKDGFADDGHGMLLVGSNLKDNDARNKAANLYLFFERKSAEELKEQFMQTNGGNAKKHPRIMLTSDRVSQLREEIKTDPYKKKWMANLKAQADELLPTAPKSYYLSDDRLLDVANVLLWRIETLAFTYQMTGDRKYAARTLAELEAVCAFPDWDPRHFLDCATIATAFTIGYDWIYDYMNEEQRSRLANKAQELALKPAKLAYTAKAPFNDFFWNTETNWGIICNGGIANLALATAEYNTDECMEILRDALRSMEFTWYRFAPDGAWYEGPGYWTYMLQHLCRFMGTYETAMGEYYGKGYKGLDKYGYFQCYFMGPDSLPNNFHDADSYNIQSEGQFVLAKMCGDGELMRYRRQQIEKHNLALTAVDVIFYDSSLSDNDSAIKLDKDKYFRETEFVTMRENWDSDDSAWLTYHGGELHNAHDQIDAGTFIYNVGGVRWAIDLGKEPLRYSPSDPAGKAGYTIQHYYRARAEGHNCVVINPSEDLEMRLFSFSKASEIKSGDDGAIGTVDLSDAYSRYVSEYTRGYRLSDGRRTFTVRDEMNLLAESDLHWFMHTEGDIQIADNNTAYIYQDGKTLKVQFLTNAAESKLSERAAVSLPTSPKFAMTPNDGVTKLDYRLKASGNTTITVKMSLVGETGSETGVDNTPIAEWERLIK